MPEMLRSGPSRKSGAVATIVAEAQKKSKLGSEPTELLEYKELLGEMIDGLSSLFCEPDDKLLDIIASLNKSIETLTIPEGSSARDIIRKDKEDRAREFSGKITVASMYGLFGDSTNRNLDIAGFMLAVTGNLASMRISKVDRFEHKEKFYKKLGGRAGYRKLLVKVSRIVNGTRARRSDRRKP